MSSYKILCLLFVFWVSCSTTFQYPETELSFQSTSEGQKNLLWGDISKISSEKSYKVYEPHEGKMLRYRAFDMVEILDAIYGKKWKTYDEVLFVAEDGYRSGISVKKIGKFKPLLAFAIEGRKNFKIDNRFHSEKNVPLGPYYLIWNNVKNPELKKEGAYGWPYQVISVDLVNLSTAYPRSAPYKKASDLVKVGFQRFKQYCMSCHAIFGEGGNKGPDLAGAAKAYGKKHMMKWMLNPQSVRKSTKMPALAPSRSESERKKIAQNIYEYLKSK